MSYHPLDRTPRLLFLGAIGIALAAGVWYYIHCESGYGRHHHGHRDSRIRGDLNTLKVALIIFKSTADRYPTTEEGLAALVTRPEGSDLLRWKGSLEEELLDPWGKPYGYQYPPKRNTRDVPDIFSAGEDMIFGTEDDIGSWDK